MTKQEVKGRLYIQSDTLYWTICGYSQSGCLLRTCIRAFVCETNWLSVDSSVGFGGRATTTTAPVQVIPFEHQRIELNCCREMIYMEDDYSKEITIDSHLGSFKIIMFRGGITYRHCYNIDRRKGISGAKHSRRSRDSIV